ncbi:interleukin-17 receptor C [Rhinichthys klamathensis goyatoka]|uniref:interleukin-17 receptor C n=1 Tax=Rhinichthys klamathensis goyatoka TaxID=3034132 RepID=UPI0024B5D21E|nr:interleukin-17 receptor C [Rhinichthys klamathensis goyatoka]
MASCTAVCSSVCRLVSGGPACLRDDERVHVTRLDASVAECQKPETRSLCLRTQLSVSLRDAGGAVMVTGDGSAEEEEEEEEGGINGEDPENTTTAASVRLCYTFPSHSFSRTIRFTVPNSALEDSTTLQVWMSLVVEIPAAKLGSVVVVHSSYTNSTKHVRIPSKEEVCKDLEAIYCKVAPRLHRRTDHVTGAITLYVADAEKWRSQEFNACQRRDRNGLCLKVEWNNTSHEFEISQGSVAPCLCFEIWGNFPRTEYCPFLNETASVSSVSVSVSEAEARDQRPALLWILTGSCRLQAQLWLCRRSSGLDTRCNALNTRSHVHIYPNNSWTQTSDRRRWQLRGEFLQVERHPLLCVQVKVAGMDGFVGPVCPFEGKHSHPSYYNITHCRYNADCDVITTLPLCSCVCVCVCVCVCAAVKRAHWIFPLVLCVLLVCLSVLGAYAVQGTLKSWVFRWLKLDDVNAAVSGGVELLLVCPPDSDATVIQLMCRLGSSLSALGFTVSLDLWNRSEINALGPVPWLHSCLERVRRSGGKAVMVLTPEACERAEPWGCRGGKPEEGTGVQSSTCSEVFDALLSRVLGDYLLGRAGERFVLAQFDGLCTATALPAFLRGLPLFSLPSQSLDFITELTQGARPGARVCERWERAGALRAASRALSGALREITGVTGGHTCPRLSEDAGTENGWETVPLRAEQSQSLLDPKISTVGWV